MKLTTITLAVAAACVFAQSAEARGYHHQRYASRNFAHHYYTHHYEHHRYARRYGHAGRYAAQPGRGDAEASYAPRRIAYRGGGGGRPRAWCGWYMRRLLGVSDPSYNLARNWAHWGRSGAPGVGAVVVWAHHVGKIVGQENGQWVIQSGNDGHAVRTRPRSIAGAIAIRWG